MTQTQIEDVSNAILGMIFYIGTIGTLPSAWRWPFGWGFMLLVITIRAELSRHREAKK